MHIVDVITHGMQYQLEFLNVKITTCTRSGSSRDFRQIEDRIIKIPSEDHMFPSIAYRGYYSTID